MRFHSPDFDQVGAAFGIPVWHASTYGEISDAISAFRAGDGTALLSVPVDPCEYDEQARG
jgi:thiamine pyrophosphate-dependent acetolactate synthase large subunit-like protein